MGALLVYDITNENSFKSMKKWMIEVKNHAEEGILITIVGNKLDVVNEFPTKRKVST
jgi:GTPase SAR1 family protein